MTIRMRWLGTACFEIKLPNKRTLVIDPYLDDSVSAPITSDGVEGCDFLFITHGHYDHILDAGKLSSRFAPKIFCNSAAAGSLIRYQGIAPQRITQVRAGDVLNEDGLVVEVVPGVHVDFAREYKRLTGQELGGGVEDPVAALKEAVVRLFQTDRLPEKLWEWMTQYPQGEQLNFVFAPEGGSRIYMAGSYPDPVVIEAAGKVNAHITLLQVLPGKTLQGIEKETARVALASGCRIVVPQHHDALFEGAPHTDLSQLKEIFEGRGVQFMELVPGRWYDFE
jgi:L-ascorbate metabolism protein UlaG (beta-lactamase superfamily)